MKTLKKFWFAVISTAIVFSVVGCSNSSDDGKPTLVCNHLIAGRNADGNFSCTCGAMVCTKTSEVTVITTATTVQMADDSAWNGYVTISDTQYKGAFIKDRKVTLSPYAMSKYEVTQELFEKVMGVNPSYFTSTYPMLPGETQKLRPVENVNWYHAIAFCNKLSILCGLEPFYEVSGITDWENLAFASIPTSYDATWDTANYDLKKKGYRLPTDAEWEFAARGGDTSKPEWKYSYAGANTKKAPANFTSSPYNDNALDAYGWYRYNLAGGASTESSEISSGTAGYGTHEVGTKKVNTLGIYDMSGNVWEWCLDWWYEYDGFRRRLRGASWYEVAYRCVVSCQDGYKTYASFHVVGFRLARSL